MNQDRTDKRSAPDAQGHDELRERRASGADDHRDDHRGETQRKPSPIEQREWRGEGVCGDRHTD